MAIFSRKVRRRLKRPRAFTRPGRTTRSRRCAKSYARIPEKTLSFLLDIRRSVAKSRGRLVLGFLARDTCGRGSRFGVVRDDVGHDGRHGFDAGARRWRFDV